MQNHHFSPLPEIILKSYVLEALKEDLGIKGDITTESLIEKDDISTLNIITRESGVISGLQLAQLSFLLLDDSIDFNIKIKDGQYVQEKTLLATVSGKASSLLTAERTALNFITYLSGIATTTKTMVDLVKDYPAQITCTRKTIPGHRMLQKYAVRCGGGINHRMGLYDSILIKDNHIAIAGGINAVIQKLKRSLGHLVPIEIEIDNLNQLEAVLNEKNISMVLLDNMKTEDLITAVSVCQGKVKTEASGGINPNNVEEIAKTGVDYIAMGYLTHSFKSLDIGLDYI